MMKLLSFGSRLRDADGSGSGGYRLSRKRVRLFREQIELAPGIRLNGSKTGISTSLGGRDFTVNLARGGYSSRRESSGDTLLSSSHILCPTGIKRR
jgi:hypothetical protein